MIFENQRGKVPRGQNTEMDREFAIETSNCRIVRPTSADNGHWAGSDRVDDAVDRENINASSTQCSTEVRDLGQITANKSA